MLKALLTPVVLGLAAAVVIRMAMARRARFPRERPARGVAFGGAGSFKG